MVKMNASKIVNFDNSAIFGELLQLSVVQQ